MQSQFGIAAVESNPGVQQEKCEESTVQFGGEFGEIYRSRANGRSTQRHVGCVARLQLRGPAGSVAALGVAVYACWALRLEIGLR
ncbi:Uncharacterised protein [Mycobacteroides abscessus subsp. massiliense]|nr:Uncharacterised protein [Mycobacteroides abscessus subsp. massiliense]